ncbi:hypothetical protein ACQJBY_067564 [Aegilops geniculata]
MPTAVAAAASPTPRDTGRGGHSRRRRRRRAAGANAGAGEGSEESARPAPDPAPQVEVEYVPEKPGLGADDPLLLGAFAAVFAKFGLADPAAAAPAKVSGPSSPPAEGEENVKGGAADAAMNKGPDAAAADAEQEDPKKEEEAVVLSKKQRKQLRRVKISELRQMCSRPDVVEVWDGNAPDPKLLVCLKSCRNTVPVPRHWCQKRKYLQGKRGFQKQPFQLPDFIAATGIEKIRQAYVQKENNNTLKQKQHNRMQPKRGNMDMDYEVLHDAFFKYQTKPKLTSYGDLYYEGKEFEPKLKVMKPGILSQELKKALGMPDGAPPPWVTRMQLFGPPPSYPYLKIPGFNAPISPGDSLGDGPDEEEPLDRSKHWGDLDEEEEELIIHGEIEEGIRSIDTISSAPAGVEAPDVIELRKLRKESDNQAERPLYQVLEQKEVRIAHRALFASSHAYVSLAKPTEYVLVGAQDTPSSSGGNFGDGPGELEKPPTDEGEPIDHWGELDEEEEEEEELEDGKLEKGILEEEEEEEVLEDGGIEEGILEEEEKKEELEDGEVEEGTLEELEEEEDEELEDGEIEEATRQAEEEELEDGEIVQGIRQEELEELEDGEIVEGILQEEEEEEELEEGEIVQGIRQEEEEEELLEEGEIVQGIRQEEKVEEELEEGEIVQVIWSGNTISSNPAGVETPDVIDLRKPWRKEPEKQAEEPLYQVM